MNSVVERQASDSSTANGASYRARQALAALIDSSATTAILAICVMQRWYQVRAQRRQLHRLVNDPQLLRDIGKSRTDALREAGKPFWKR